MTTARRMLTRALGGWIGAVGPSVGASSATSGTNSEDSWAAPARSGPVAMISNSWRPRRNPSMTIADPSTDCAVPSTDTRSSNAPAAGVGSAV